VRGALACTRSIEKRLDVILKDAHAPQELC